MGRSAQLFGLLGLVSLAFGFVGIVLVGIEDPFVLFNVVAGLGLLLAYLAFGLDSFRSLLGQRSTRYGAGALLYSVLFIALVAGLNYLGVRYQKKWDVTEAGVYTLSPQSAKVVQGLQQPLEMTAFVEGGIDPGLEALFESFEYSAPDKVTFRLVDPDKEPALVEQMKITVAPSVHLKHGNESFVVAQPTEETVTNGVIRVARTKRKVVYFTEGFGEARIDQDQDPKGYSQAKLALEQENYEVRTLLLLATGEIPADADVVIVAGPTQELTEPAIKALGDYLRRGGRLLLMVGPRAPAAQITTLLADWGITLGQDIVLDREVRLFEGPKLGLNPVSRTYGVHPITERFRDFTVYPQTRTVEPVAEPKKGLQATPLVKTSDSSWAETNVDGVFTQGTAALDGDRQGPLTVAVAVNAKLADLGVTVPEGGAPEARLVVLGTAMFADNQQLVQSRVNLDLFLNAVGWLVGQEELVSIRSRSVRTSRADLTPDEVGQLFYLSVLIVPQVLIAFGIAVWWQRKSR